MVQATKTNLIIQGQGYLSTAIEWNDTASFSGGTFYSSTFTIFASKFTAYNINFKVNIIVLSYSFFFSFIYSINYFIFLAEYCSSYQTRSCWGTICCIKIWWWPGSILRMRNVWCAGHITRGPWETLLQGVSYRRINWFYFRYHLLCRV